MQKIGSSKLDWWAWAKYWLLDTASVLIDGEVIPFFFFFFGHTAQHVGSYLPDQGSNPRPLHWKRGVLTIGPPRKSGEVILDSKRQGKTMKCDPTTSWPFVMQGQKNPQFCYF